MVGFLLEEHCYALLTLRQAALGHTLKPVRLVWFDWNCHMTASLDNSNWPLSCITKMSKDSKLCHLTRIRLIWIWSVEFLLHWNVWAKPQYIESDHCNKFGYIWKNCMTKLTPQSDKLPEPRQWICVFIAKYQMKRWLPVWRGLAGGGLDFPTWQNHRGILKEEKCENHDPAK